ncbi:retinoic acid receptor responder protein 1 [Panthera pardus]|uniref:Retinoic acid receptor responder protein 1 n=1 Tax=Panthera pardus TaxID=9691 RepID=A0A9W2VN86_PANPR|nr:retinoic acid receptor responder protein 1 [Panthera pardus]
MVNGPVQFISRNKRSLHYLQDEAAPIIHIPQTPAGGHLLTVSSHGGETMVCPLALRDEMYTKVVLHHVNCNFLNQWCLKSDPWGGTSSISIPWELVRSAKPQAHPGPTGILMHIQVAAGTIPVSFTAVLSLAFPTIHSGRHPFCLEQSPNLMFSQLADSSKPTTNAAFLEELPNLKLPLLRFRNRSNCRGEKPAHGLGWGRGAGWRRASRAPSGKESPLPPSSPASAAGAGHPRPRVAEAPPRPGIEPGSWGPGGVGVGRGGGAQGLEAAPRGRGRARTRARGSGPPRGRRGVARRGLISSSAGAAHLAPVRRTPRPPASMPPRLQPPPASGTGRPRAAVLPLALLLSLALQGVAAAPAGAGEPEDSLRRRDPELPRGLLEQAARAALHFVNFRAGSPSTLRVLADVLEGRARVNPKKECQVDLVFTTDRYNPEEGEERLGKCSARVFFRNQKPRPAINVTCTRLIEKNKRQQEDYLLYKHMKQLKTPLDVVSIPDSHGHIDPSLRPIWDLAFLGGSYVMWEKTTQFLHYYMAQLSSVNQWKTNDDAIDFDYTVLLHEFSTQEIIPCRIHLVWYPGKPLKVKYHCQELQTPEEASGTEEGSAVAPTELNNF